MNEALYTPNKMQALLTVGVVSDTHIPDRVGKIPEELLDCLRSLEVDLILHAGDISVPSVVDVLAKIAPIQAVRGNRDLFLPGKYKHHLKLELAGTPVLLTHGHGNFFSYLVDKGKHLAEGYSFARYKKALLPLYPQARVIVFGHTHFAENRWEEGKLFFNPGSCTMALKNQKPSFGVLQFFDGGKRVRGEIRYLNG
ncbi:MAG: metallophosphoesterase family protein [Anaerolineaceae bacterium]|nr:metallophosphoesterase family protein [Anaerolineaceae bacterium]